MINFNIDKRPVKNISKDNHLGCGAYLSDQSESKEFFLKHEIELNHSPATTEGVFSWYTHETINPRPIYFCSCITKDNLYNFAGFDKRFAR